MHLGHERFSLEQAALLAGDGLRIRPSGLIGTVLGAIVVLAIWGAVRGKSRSAGRGGR